VTKGQTTRDAIVHEALVHATRVGLEGLSLGVLADSLSLSKSGLFAHFKSKEVLQRAVLEHAIELFARHVVLPALARPRGRPRLIALFHNMLAWKRGDSTPDGCVFGQLSVEYDDRPGALRDLIVESQRELRRTIVTCVDKAITEGHFRGDVDPDQFAFDLLGITMSYAEAHKLLAIPDALDRAERAFQRLLDDAAPAPASPTSQRRRAG
jgi:AcrR family transcriptional regulator